MNAEAHQPEAKPPDSTIDFVSVPVGEMLTGDRRLEGESYLSEGYLIRKQIETSRLPVEALEDLADVWQPSRLKGIQVTAEHGQPFFTATQVFDIRPKARKWLAPRWVAQLEQRYVEPGWILVTCSGSVGDAIVSYSAHRDAIISHDLLRVQVYDSEELGYLYAFLRTRVGRAMMRSSKYGSI